MAAAAGRAAVHVPRGGGVGWPGQGTTRIGPWLDACQEKHEKFLACFRSRDFTRES